MVAMQNAPKQNFGWAVAYPAYAAAPLCFVHFQLHFCVGRIGHVVAGNANKN